MALQYEGRIFLELFPERVHGLPGLALHRLGFSFRYMMHSYQPGIVARNFRADTTLVGQDGGQIYIGMAQPENAWVMQATNTSKAGHYAFRINLTDEQLEKIETLRAGGDLQFLLFMMCDVSGGREALSAFDDIRIHVQRSAWLEVMKSFGVDRRVVLEIDLPDLKSGALPSAVHGLRRARTELDAGNYDGVVRECRIALESVRLAFKLDDPIRQALAQYVGNERRQMTKGARALLLNEFAMHYAHLAHHPDDEGQRVDFGRRDAAFALAIASAVVANSASMSRMSGTD